MSTAGAAEIAQDDVSVVQLDYVPGDWVGIAGSGLWLLIETEPGAPIVREYWRLVRSSSSATDVLDTVYLYSAQSQGFAFVAVGPDSTRAVVRGNAGIRLLASTDSPVTVLEGAGDRFLDWRAIGFQLTAGSISHDPVALVADRPLLPLESGVVQASAILWNEAFAPRPTPVEPVQVELAQVELAQVELAQVELAQVGEADPDFAPTEIVVPQAVVVEPLLLEPLRSEPAGLEPIREEPVLSEPAPLPPLVDDPDFAPTEFVAPRTLTPAPPLAPPSGPRIELEPVFEQDEHDEQIEQIEQVAEVELLLEQPVPMEVTNGAPLDREPVHASADPEPDTNATTDADADESLIWKLDWWGTGDKSSAPAPTVSQPLVQPQQTPHLPVPPPVQPAPVPAPTSQPEPATPEPVAFEASPVEDDTSVTVHRPGTASSGADAAGQRPSVPAVRCPEGHLNPPAATQCRVCAATVPPQESFPIPQPVLGVLRLSTGGDIPLDRDVFLGRDPSHSEERMARKPHLLRLPSPGKDISRDHLEIRLVGWRVMAIDLGSVNGTKVIAPGGTPEALAAGASRMIEPGTQVVLADEVSFVYEVPR